MAEKPCFSVWRIERRYVMKDGGPMISVRGSEPALEALCDILNTYHIALQEIATMGALATVFGSGTPSEIAERALAAIGG